MAKKPGEKTLKELVQEEVKELAQEEQQKQFPPDEEFNPSIVNQGGMPFGGQMLNPPGTGRQRLFGPPPKSAEEIVIDELLASVPRGQGYYLKLYKEIAPNQWEYKMRIDNYTQWSDMELEVNNIVRAYTKKSRIMMNKWGSGRYRIIVFRDGGLRGPKYNPMDFLVDAEEPEQFLIEAGGTGVRAENIDPAQQLDSLANLMETVKRINPTPSPDKILEITATAQARGQEAKAAENQTMMTLVTTLLTAILQRQNGPSAPPLDVAALVGGLGALLQRQQSTENPIDVLIKLKQAGLVPDSNAKGSEIDMIKSLIPVIVSAAGQGGGGEPPSVAIKLIETLGPQLGKAVSEITSTIREAMTLKALQAGQVKIAPATQIPTTQTPVQRPIRPTPPVEGGSMPAGGARGAGAMDFPDGLQVGPEMPINGTPTNGNGNHKEENVLPVFKTVQVAIERNDRNFFPTLRDLLKRATNENEYYGIITGQIPIDSLLTQVATYGGRFFLTPQARAYLVSFIEWERAQITAKGQVNGDEGPLASAPGAVVAHCEKCNDHYQFDSMEDYNEDPLCQECQGKLTLVTDDQPAQ